MKNNNGMLSRNKGLRRFHQFDEVYREEWNNSNKKQHQGNGAMWEVKGGQRLLEIRYISHNLGLIKFGTRARLRAKPKPPLAQ
jgi:hypothetical protein